MLGAYDEDQRERARTVLSTQLRASVTSSVIDRKLRERLVAIATGEAPALELAAPADDTADDTADDVATAHEESAAGSDDVATAHGDEPALSTDADGAAAAGSDEREVFATADAAQEVSSTSDVES